LDGLPDLSPYYTESETGDEADRIDPEELEVRIRNQTADLSRMAPEKYMPLGELGRGSMKSILKVKDRDTARNIAMAVMQSADSPSRVKRFVHEARIAANLEHPNIIPVHDIGIDSNGMPYFTMKLVKGRSLSEILEKLAIGNRDTVLEFPLMRLLDIFKKVCDAIAFSHANGIIHLDLKPENIQVGNFGEVLVCDWGLAKIIRPDEFFSTKHLTTQKLFNLSNIEKTMVGTVKGTPGYMAPEQAAGENEGKDKRTDVYALGAILYSILSLRVPVDGANIHEVILKTVHGEIVPPTLRNPGRLIPRALEAVAMKAMSVDPSERYQSVPELLREIDAFLGGFATIAEGAGILRQSFLLLKRRRQDFYMTVAGILLILLTVLIVLFQLQQREQIAIQAGDDAIQALARSQELQGKTDAARRKAEKAVDELKSEIRMLKGGAVDGAAADSDL
jgi:serine/threonine protein kinase